MAYLGILLIKADPGSVGVGRPGILLPGGSDATGPWTTFKEQRFRYWLAIERCRKKGLSRIEDGSAGKVLTTYL